MKVRRPRLRAVLIAILFASLASTVQLWAAPWMPFGPDGGDARRFARDPHDSQHIYLGTANGWLYETHNGGSNWLRLSQPGKRDDLVLDGIVLDPNDAKHLIVGAWVVGANDGGLFITHDGGKTWVSQAEMRGQSIRALTASVSDPKILVAGTLKGVYRSTDGAQRWKLISPPDSTEIHDVQSVAIDPKDPGTVYAGTWHLPWKTTDAGENWDNVKQGIAEDSDVFSIIVDPISPQIVYASACSGIYKSQNAGLEFHKVEGIPTSARRTRVLLQDPGNLDTVFAGTTEGLFRSQDAARTWNRTTDPGVIVNDVFVDSSNSRHVLLATDRGGVLASDDGGDTFHPSNGGFSARQITALKGDAAHPATIFVGVVNDKEWGGVFQSDNGGLSWAQRSGGLEGRDVFALGQAPDGTMIAGTSHGIFRLDRDAEAWTRVLDAPPSGAEEPDHAAPIQVRPPVPVARNQFAARTGLKINSVRSPRQTLASTRAGRGAIPGRPNPKTGAAKAGAAKPGVKSASKPSPKTAAARARLAAASKRSAALHGKPQPALRAAGSKPSARPVHPAHPAALEHAAADAASVIPAAPKAFDGSVFALAACEKVLLAATSSGMLSSMDNGVSWQPAGPDRSSEWRYLAAAKQNVVAGSLHQMQFSADSGATWNAVKLPEALTQVSAIAVEPSGEMWVGGREGVFVSSDAGVNWTTPKNLFVSSVNSIYYDEPSNRVFVTASGAANVAFIVQLPVKSVSFAETGWNLRFVRPVGDHLMGATFYDGVVIQPRMIPSAMDAHETASR